jgi:hypothetical protein
LRIALRRRVLSAFPHSPQGYAQRLDVVRGIKKL